METTEARARLGLYRPGVDDPADPFFAEALALAQTDPELARWLAAEQALDAAFADKLKPASSVPADLKTNLLGLANVVAPPPDRWRQRWLPALAGAAVAAAVTWLAALATLRPAPTPPPTERTVERLVETSATLEDFRAEMVSFLQLTPSLEYESKDVDDLRATLRRDGSPDGDEIPTGLLALSGKGCRTLFFRGHKVGFLCFERKNGQLAHFLVVDRAAISDAAGTREQPQYRGEGQWMTATWVEGDLVHLVTVKGDEKTLSGYLNKI